MEAHLRPTLVMRPAGVRASSARSSTIAFALRGSDAPASLPYLPPTTPGAGVKGVALVFSPALGGILVVGVGAGWAVGVNGVTYLLAAALLLPIKLPAKQPGARTSIVIDLREGWRFFRTTTWLWIIVLAFGFLNALASGAFNTLGPAQAKATEIGVGGWSVILSAGACGLVVTSLVFLRVTLRRPLWWGMLGCAVFSSQIIALGLTTEVWIIALAAFAAGAGIEIFGLGWDLAMQENVPGDMLSRVYSYDMLGSFVAIPAGQLAFGPLGAHFGLQHVILVAGLSYAAISLLTLLSGSVRGVVRAPVTSTTSAPAS